MKDKSNLPKSVIIKVYFYQGKSGGGRIIIENLPRNRDRKNIQKEYPFNDRFEAIGNFLILAGRYCKK